MYKLVITFGKGPSRKVESRDYWMTHVGLHKAYDDYEELLHRQDVMALQLWRQDLTGTYVLRWWERKCER